MIVQAQWIDESAITTLPHIRKDDLHLFSSFSTALPKLCFVTRDDYNRLKNILCKDYHEDEIREVTEFVEKKYIVI